MNKKLFETILYRLDFYKNYSKNRIAYYYRRDFSNGMYISIPKYDVNKEESSEHYIKMIKSIKNSIKVYDI